MNARIWLWALLLTCVWVAESEAVTQTRYTKPSSEGATGNLCTTASRCTNQTAIAASVGGDTISMLAGTITNPKIYKGTADVFNPITTNGSQGVPVFAICEGEDGGCVVDGEWARIPLYLNGNHDWEFRGMNFKRSSSAVIRGIDCDRITFKKVMAWDSPISVNAHPTTLERCTYALFEDFASFGTGRKGMSINYGSDAVDDHTVCRRCWFRWDGHTAGGDIGSTITYRSPGFTWENVLTTWGGEAMPQQYTIPAGSGTGHDGSLVTGYKAASVGGVSGTDRIVAYSTPKNAKGRIYGSMVYLKANAKGLPSPWVANDGPMLLWIYGLSDVIITDFVAVNSNQSANFNQVMGIALSRRPHNCACVAGTQLWSPTCTGQSGGPCEDPVVGNSLTRMTSVRGTRAWGGNIGDSFGSNNAGHGYLNETDWSVPVANRSQGNCVTNSTANPCGGNFNTPVQSPFQSGAITGATVGARLCFRTENGVLTQTGLWPWPMNERIKQATIQAGAYDGPTCQVNCTATGTRTATDVTADIEALLGPIPAACRTGAAVIFPPAPSYTPPPLTSF